MLGRDGLFDYLLIDDARTEAVEQVQFSLGLAENAAKHPDVGAIELEAVVEGTGVKLVSARVAEESHPCVPRSVEVTDAERGGHFAEQGLGLSRWRRVGGNRGQAG